MAQKKIEIENLIPEEPIDAFLNPLKRFLHIEAASGIFLLCMTIAALVLANSAFSETFTSFWKTKTGFMFGSFQMQYSLQHWINDGLMAVFFFVIGMEVKRELVMGELRDLRQAALPIAAAFGGMLVPAGIYLFFLHGTPAERGWGIPMATDIAFVVGCLAVLGSRIPNSLRVFLLSLAIADDIGAILVIAIGYTETLNMWALMIGIAGVFVVIGLVKAGFRNAGIYFLIMFLSWFAYHESGVHATIAGVIFGLLMPHKPWISEGVLYKILRNSRSFFEGKGWHNPGERYATLRQMGMAAHKSISPLEQFETVLHPWVGFFIMPVFALANAGVAIQLSDFSNPIAAAVGLGLLAGKPIGIVLFSWLAVKIGFAKLPDDINWGGIVGGGFLSGIGFTMALFIAGLALNGDPLDAAKVGIIVGSALSAIIGVIILIIACPKKSQ